MPIEKYGARFATDDPIAVELKLYSETDVFRSKCRGALSRWEHLRNAIKMLLPENVFCFHRWVDAFGEEWCERTAITCWGAGGTTKSGIVGALAYVDLLASPSNTLTVMVTNPMEKHLDRCFSKSENWMAAVPERWRLGKRHGGTTRPAILTNSSKGSRTGIICISIADGDSDAEIQKKVGAHAARTRLILEEAQSLPPAALSIATNLFLGSTCSKSIHIGNPTVWNGNALGVASVPLDEDTRKIDTELPDRWESKLTWGDKPGVVLVFDGTKSPSLDSREEGNRLSMMIRATDIQHRRDLPGGENSMEWWSQVRGRITPNGVRTVVISELDIQKSGAMGPRPWAQSGGRVRYGGVDLSMGGDGVIAVVGEVGPVQMGIVPGHGNSAPVGSPAPHVCQVLAKEQIPVDVTSSDRSMQIARGVIAFVEKHKIPWENMCFDSTGQQGAIVDTVEREAGVIGRCIRVNSSHAVSERKVGPKGETAKDRYRTRAAELVLQLCSLIMRQQICRLPKEVSYQLSTRGLVQEDGKADIEPKKDWKRANKGKSPDELDAVAVMTEGLLQRKVLSLATQWQPLAAQSELPAWMMPTQPTHREQTRRRRMSNLVRRW